MAMAFLRRWLGWPPVQRLDLEFVVYTRAACPLCDEAWSLLQRYQASHGFLLHSQSIDESAELTREYGEWIPVVAINGRVQFRGRVNEVLLKRILDAKGANELKS